MISELRAGDIIAIQQSYEAAVVVLSAQLAVLTSVLAILIYRRGGK